MSRFHVKRSLKQLYIEKHSLERQILEKEKATDINDMTVKQFNDLRSEKHFLSIVKDEIAVAEEFIKREKVSDF